MIENLPNKKPFIGTKVIVNDIKASETGYALIATVDGYDTNFYLDNNNGEGLVQGYEYCYIITAIYDYGNI